MPAFQAYAGDYEFDGKRFSWRCYATTRLYEIRSADHAPFPQAPQGRKWMSPVQQDYERTVGCLVDEAVEDFSQILLQVSPKPAAVAAAALAARSA
jgi:hypothetical protein